MYRNYLNLSLILTSYYYYFDGNLQHLTSIPTLLTLNTMHVWPHFHQYLLSQITINHKQLFTFFFWNSQILRFFILHNFLYFRNADASTQQYQLFQLFFWLNTHTTRGCCVYVGKPCRGQRTHTNARSAFYVTPQLKLFVKKLKLINKLERRAIAKHWTQKEIKRLRIDKRLQKIELKIKQKRAKPHKLTIKKKKKSIWS